MAQHSKRPYKLPAMLRAEAEDIERFEDREEIDSAVMDTVKKYIDLHERYLRRYQYLEALYKGFHSIYDLPEKPDWKPDHRLAVNFPRYMTETFSGYGYGVPIKVTYKPDEESAQAEAVNEAVQDFGKGNEIDDHNAEMVKKTCIYGHAFEYLYQNEDEETKITACSPIELFVVYDDSIRDRALFAIRYWYKETEYGVELDPVGELMTRTRIYHFEDGKVVDMVENPYGYIPVVEWRMNDERIGLYEEVAGLIETYNMTLGEKANDVDAFAEAYMAITGSRVDEDAVKQIREDRVINVYGTEDANGTQVYFITKPSADGTQENLLNRLEDLIYETSMVANISDESFGNATSGVALQYKLQAMSNLALSFDRKIEKSLKKRYKIFCSLPTNVSDPDAYRDLDIVFTRNLPANTSEEIAAAKELAGIVSQETQLSRLSFVKDVKAEADRIREESMQAVQDNLDMMEKQQQVLGNNGE